MKKAFILSLLCVLLSSFVIGCGPRGETKTLEEVFQNEKTRYAAVKEVKEKSPLATRLADLDKKLEGFVAASPSATQSTATEIAEILVGIIPHAGYTSRPGLGELAAQYRVYSSSENAITEKSKSKLLAARTYSALAAELETTKFAL